MSFCNRLNYLKETIAKLVFSAAFWIIKATVCVFKPCPNWPLPPSLIRIAAQFILLQCSVPSVMYLCYRSHVGESSWEITWSFTDLEAVVFRAFVLIFIMLPSKDFYCSSPLAKSRQPAPLKNLSITGEMHWILTVALTCYPTYCL